MEWKDELHPDDAGKFKGIIKLRNDKQQVVGSVCWFFDRGPFYAAAVMPTEPDVMHRIGPIDTLEHAKEEETTSMTFHTRDRAFSCDECPESIDVETSDFSEGLETAKKAGWRRFKGPDHEWADACPVCVSEFAKRKR